MKTTKIFAALCCVAALFAACEPQTNDPNNGQNNNNSNQNGEDASGSANGYDYVDLGLPSGLKWATCNVGSDKPEGYGDYFAWGRSRIEAHLRLEYVQMVSGKFYYSNQVLHG